MKHGQLEAIVGCMSSGKSEELIRRLRRAAIAKQKVIVFKPVRDSRTDAVTIASRDGHSHQAISVDNPEDIGAWIEANGFVGVVGIDEAQFFAASIVEVAERLVASGLRVIVVGLDTDFFGRPFGPVPQLMAVADSVTKLTAVCVCCGAPATRSQLKRPPRSADGNIVVGGDELYEARCRDCFEVPAAG
ncbi:MAG: thymidine kinase [Patescibacteria group bacterium]|jgi:thymidine kinase